MRVAGVLQGRLITHMAFAKFWGFARVLTAARHPDDKEGWRTTIVMLICPWIWGLWIIDSRGWGVTGVEIIGEPEPFSYSD